MKQSVPYKGKIKKYIWHVSWPKHRQSILKNGLLPQSFEKSYWSKCPDMFYPPSIFVNNHSNYDCWFYLDEAIWIPQAYNQDFWRIDTSNLKNNWFYDTNLSQDGSSLYTTEPILAENLKLYLADNIACSECNTLICGLSINVVFKPYKGRKEKKCKRMHNSCYHQKKKSSFDLEDLENMKRKKSIINLPLTMKKENKTLLLYDL